MFKEYTFFGIRTSADDENYKAGDTCRKSYEWDYENDVSTYDTDNPIELPGTCSIELEIDEGMTEEEIMELIKETTCNYVGEQIIVIGGNEAEYGSDENEIIIADAKILMVL